MKKTIENYDWNESIRFKTDDSDHHSRITDLNFLSTPMMPISMFLAEIWPSKLKKGKNQPFNGRERESESCAEKIPFFQGQNGSVNSIVQLHVISIPGCIK